MYINPMKFDVSFGLRYRHHHVVFNILGLAEITEAINAISFFHYLPINQQTLLAKVLI